MFIKSSIDLKAMDGKPTSDGMYKICYITEGYDDEKSMLTKESCPAIVLHSHADVPLCVFNKLKNTSRFDKLPEELDIKYDLDNKYVLSTNFPGTIVKAREMHAAYLEKILAEINEVLDIIDMGVSSSSPKRSRYSFD